MIIKDKYDLINKMAEIILNDNFRSAVIVTAHNTDDEEAFEFNCIATNALEANTLLNECFDFFTLKQE